MAINSIEVIGQNRSTIYKTDFETTLDTTGWGEFTTFYSDPTLDTSCRGWYIYNTSTPTDNTGPDIAQSGSIFAYFEHSRPILIDPMANCTDVATPMISPPIVLNGDSTELRFWFLLRGSNPTFGDTSKLTVSVLSGPNFTINDTIFGPLSNGRHSGGNQIDWEEAVIDLSKYDSTTVRLSFMATIGDGTIGTRGDIGIDNLFVSSFLPLSANPIPTLGEWGIVILSLSLLVVLCIGYKHSLTLDL